MDKLGLESWDSVAKVTVKSEGGTTAAAPMPSAGRPANGRRDGGAGGANAIGNEVGGVLTAAGTVAGVGERGGDAAPPPSGQFAAVC